MTKTDDAVVALYLSVDEAEYIIALIELNEEVEGGRFADLDDAAKNLISKIKHRIPAKTGWMTVREEKDTGEKLDTAREERDAAMRRRGFKPMDRS